MAYDGIVTAAVAKELEDALLYGKIDKIYQPEKQELLIHIHTKKGKKQLYACVNPERPGLYISEENFTNPPSPGGFCMLLRKLLQGGRIMKISQVDFERIVEIELETRDEMRFSTNKKLVFEIMGKHSNIILVDTVTGKVNECIKKIPQDLSRVRPLYPGILYTYPPKQDKIPPNEISACKLDKSMNPKEIVTMVQGLSPILGEVIFNSENRLFTLNKILENIENPTPLVFFKEGKTGTPTPKDFHIFSIDAYKEIEPERFKTISEAIEYFYKNRLISNRIKQKSSDLLRHLNNLIKKQQLKKQRLSEDIMKAENCEEHKLLGELITANLHRIEPGDKSVTVINYYNGKEQTVPLDETLSPSQNAQKYYKSYNKSKTAIKEKNHQLEKCLEEIRYLESVEAHLFTAKEDDDIEQIKFELASGGYIGNKKNTLRLVKNQKNTKKRNTPVKYTTSGGMTVLVGKNNRENDVLTFKTASGNDIWLHTKDIPGSHTILITEGREPDDKDLFEAAGIAAYHSKGQDSENVPVDYTLIKYVKKPKGANPGMVIFTHNRTLYVTPEIPEK